VKLGFVNGIEAMADRLKKLNPSADLHK